MENFIHVFDFLKSNPTRQALLTVLAIFSLWVIHKLVSLFIDKHCEDIKIAYFLRKALNYVLFFLGIFIVARIWIHGVQSIATFLGLISAGLAIALKDFVMDVAAWIFLLIKRPFEVGDRIEIDGLLGDVVDITMMKVSLLEVGNWVDGDQSTGRVVQVPNSSFLTHNVLNSNAIFPFIWHEIHVLLTFESDWKKCQQVFHEILLEKTEPLMPYIEKCMGQARKQHLIYYKNVAPKIYLTVKDSGIQLSLRFLCSPTKRRELDHDLWISMLHFVDDSDDVDLAYPTVRYIKS